MGVSLLVVPRTISVEIASIVASLDSQFAGVCPPVPPSPVALEVVEVLTVGLSSLIDISIPCLQF